jgi:hypothetical protein
MAGHSLPVLSSVQRATPQNPCILIINDGPIHTQELTIKFWDRAPLRTFQTTQERVSTCPC